MIQASGKRRRWGLAGMGLLAVGAAFAAGLNDTGQTTCYDDSSAVSPEPGTHPRQDCTIGRDAAAAAGILPKTDAGSKGFDYIKIASDGSALPASVTNWSCVLDNLTGLTWEVKTDDGGPRDQDWTYSWYDDIHTDNNGGNAGSKGSDTCGGTLPNSLCNTQAYTAAVNTAGLCGYSDWRLPTIEELMGLVDYGMNGMTIDPAYFPNTVQSLYWSSSVYANGPYGAWYVDFFNGYVYANLKANYYRVRLVRGGQ